MSPFSMRPRLNFITQKFHKQKKKKKATRLLKHKHIEVWDTDIQLHCPNLIAEISGAGGGR